MSPPVCLTQRVFYWLRQDLVQILEVDRHAVRPSARMATLLEDDQREAFWKYIDCGGPFTEAGRTLASQGFEEPPRPRGLLGGISAWLHARRERQRFALALHSFTVRDTVVYLCGFLHRRFGQGWTHEEISLRVRLLMAAAAGVPFEVVRPETSLPDLFG